MSPPFLVSISDTTLARRLGAKDMAPTRRALEAARINDIYFMSGSAILAWPIEDVVVAEFILAAKAASKQTK